MGAPLIHLESFPVTCPICGEQLLKIDRKHATSHGLTLEQFKSEHGYTTLLQRSRNKIKELYRPDFTRWGTTYNAADGARYVTKRYFAGGSVDSTVKSATRFPLNDNVFNRHFSGANVLAVFPRGDKSSVFFAFDVDSKEKAPDHVRLIVQTLQSEGIPLGDIHVSFSGGKGYHIDLFTQRPVDIERWLELGRYVVAQAGLVGEEIEFRPTKGNANAFKLPLTLHPKTGAFACFIDPITLEPKGILASHEYLFAIQPMNREHISAVLFKARQHAVDIERLEAEAKAKQKKEKPERKNRQAVKVHDERVFQTTEEKRRSTERALKEGLIEQGTRWFTTRSIALYLFHEMGADTEWIRTFLAEWTADQISQGKVNTPYDRCLAEIDDLLEWVPTTDSFKSVKRDLMISASEVAWVLSVDQPSARDLLWALLLRGKAYAGRKGTFFTGDRSLQDMFRPVPLSRKTIARWRKWLVAQGFIEANVPPPSRHARKATTYRLLFQAPTDSEVVGEVDFSHDMDCRELLRTVAAKICDSEQLQTMKLLPPTTENVEGVF